jgi:hypothetical protein
MQADGCLGGEPPELPRRQLTRGTYTCVVSIQSTATYDLARPSPCFRPPSSPSPLPKHAPAAGIPKLDDANDAGGRNSERCTLILTEGDSAKSLAISGLSVVGRDSYGVFPLRGKLLNVRDASAAQITGNAEINNIKQILGLQHGKVCERGRLGLV